jgi:hypothetical protein
VKKVLKRLLRGKRDGERKPLLPRLILPLCVLAIFVGGLGIGVAWSTPQTSVDWAQGYADWAKEHTDEGYDFVSDIEQGPYAYIGEGVNKVGLALYGPGNYAIYTYTQSHGVLTVLLAGRRMGEMGAWSYDLLALTWAYSAELDKWQAVDVARVATA